MEQTSDYPFITPSSTSVSDDLLFFDTFSHSSSDKDNFDLVQFPSPVIIDLIKIVPLGQPIEAKIPGNVRLGATNPSKCELEFFINDLTKQDAHTMTDLGKFYCSEKDTDFSPPLLIQTDGLLLRGSYRTLTLAIFGQIVAYDEKPDEEQAVLSAVSPPAQTPASPVASDRDIPYIVRSVDQDYIRRTRDGDESLEESTLKSGELLKDESLTDNVDMNEDAMMDLVGQEQSKKPTLVEESSNSDAEPQAKGAFSSLITDKKDEEVDYSNSSDLDNTSRRSHREEDSRQTIGTPTATSEQQHNEKQPSEDYVADLDAKEWSFDVGTYSPKPLVYFPDPSLTLQERTLQSRQLKADNSSHQNSLDKEVEKVKEMFDLLSCSNDLKTEEWVTLLEDLTNDITSMSLSQTVGDEEMLKFLVKQVIQGLDISLALRQKQTGFKVRHLRAGLKLATVLFQCGQPSLTVLLEAGIPHRVLKLYNEDQMSLPLRLLIIRCMSTICSSIEGVQHFITHEYNWDDGGYLISKLKQSSATTDSMTEANKDHQNQEIRSFTCYQYMLLILMSQPTTRIKIAIGNFIKRIRFYQNLAQLNECMLTRQSSLKDIEESEDSVFESDQDTSTRNSTTNMEKQRIDTSLSIVQDLVSLLKNGCSEIAQPIRHLPAKTQFHVRPSSSDNYTAIYKWMKHFRTIDCLNCILSSRINEDDIEQSVKLQSLCLTLIQQLLNSPRSTQLFLSNDCYESTERLLKTLATKEGSNTTKRSSNVRMSGIECLPDASLYREECLLPACCKDMSLRLIYSFKVFACIDKLFAFHEETLNERRGGANDTSLSSSVSSPATVGKAPTDPEKVLHQLYIMSDHPYGLAAIMKHFSCIGNLDCVLRFLDMPEHQKQLEFVRETSIDYVLELVGTFLRLNNNVLEIAEEYLDTLMDLCKTKNKNLSVRISSLLPWLNPFDLDQPFPLITYSEETLKQLTRVLRKSIPDCSIPFAQGLNYELPPQMITAVRILRQLCIPPQVETFIETNFDLFSSYKLTATLGNMKSTSTFLPFVDSLPHQQNHNQSWNLNLQMSRSSPPEESQLADQLSQLSHLSKLYQPYEETICGDLKYHYAIMQVYEQEGLRRLLNTMRELVGNYPRPSYQSAALSSFRGRIVISYINSVIVLLHSITCHLIDARGKEFKDTSIIPVILETYSLLCFVPKPETDKLDELLRQDTGLGSLQNSFTLKSDNYQLAQQTKKLILSILMSYTQMCLSVSESEENVISKSLWTKMLKEVIEFTLSAPVFFQHGLDILTKILPAPLPCSSLLDSIDQEQLFKNINHRKLWSAHLHPLHQRIEQMISNLSLCYQSNIRALLYYLCNQLCDLSSNAACLVAKIVTDTLVSCASKLHLDSATTTTTMSSSTTTTTTTTTLTTNANTSNVSNTTISANDPSNQQQSHSIDHDEGAIQQQQHPPRGSEDRFSQHIVALNGTKENKFAVKMILNLLSNLITNQAFETALTNNLQLINKKDEKLLINLNNIIRLQDESRASESHHQQQQHHHHHHHQQQNNQHQQHADGLGSNSNTCGGNNSGGGGGAGAQSTVSNLIESIKLIASDGLASATSRENFSNAIVVSDVTPPDELTKINLIEMARKTSDRFNLTTGITKTYRLKVLLDMNSRAAHRPGDPSLAAAASSSSSGQQQLPPQGSSSAGGQSGGGSAAPPKRFSSYGQGGYHGQADGPGGGLSNHQKALYAASSGGGGGGGGGPRAGRNRSGGGYSRPDSFRSRPQNTSRPPSIHVDDFMDLYGESSGSVQSSGGRYPATSSSSSSSKQPPPGDYHHHHHHHHQQQQQQHHHHHHHHNHHQQHHHHPSPHHHRGSSGAGGGGGGGPLAPPPPPHRRWPAADAKGAASGGRLKVGRSNHQPN